MKKGYALGEGAMFLCLEELSLEGGRIQEQSAALLIHKEVKIGQGISEALKKARKQITLILTHLKVICTLQTQKT